ncbi:MAG: hypothetical protein WCK65_13690 [Rhodospirillaceae bacterium]
MSAAMILRRLGRPRLEAVIALAVLVLVATGLGGCGKKPGHVDPPEDAGPDSKYFPRVYPNTKYDPQPRGGAQVAAPGTAGPAGTAGTAGPHGTAAPAELPPMVPTQSYPRIIRPDDLTPTSALSLPGRGGGTPSWPGSPRAQ